MEILPWTIYIHEMRFQVLPYQLPELADFTSEFNFVSIMWKQRNSIHNNFDNLQPLLVISRCSICIVLTRENLV